MTDLSNLFSTSSPPRSPPRRSSEPLFLSPSNSSLAPTPKARRPKSTRRPSSPRPLKLEIDDLDDLGDLELPDLPPSLRVGGNERQREYVDPLAGLDFGTREREREGEDGGKVGKKRKPIPKVDADRLMGERGIPALMRAAKRFKSKGKGQEVTDLRDLLNVYQMWAHGMFPKGDFAGTINRIENVCRTRRMENAMKGYREAFYPPARSPTPPALSPPDGTYPEPASETRNSNAAAASTQGDDVPVPMRQPMFEPSQGPGDGDPEIEDMMALEEMEREEAERGDKARAGDEDGPPSVEEEDEWEGLYD